MRNDKREMTAKVESGQKMVDVARHYGLNRGIFEKLKEQTPGSSSEELEFKATTSWFTKFKRRSGIKHVLMHGESASADKESTEKYCLKFQEFIETEGYRSQQIFNCDEIGLFWKRMPNHIYITKDEKSIPGHKPMKDRLTLLLGANASGDMKLKPLFVYHSENPRALKKFHN
ncbi:tigger transposable element-derived protein 1 [Trichonephila clavata]|uniref:Tigger transposable element-derived protein 1 n=1 Tax=Trichonephila clavata TaxID=2740835 RepID=A0A8X6K9M2_TRICU|nr:tigger transposable element-derived protein 1 [Trichonephila clavata]